MSVVYCEVEVSVMGLSLIRRSPTECGVSKAGIHLAILLATRQQVQLPGTEQAGSKRSVPVTCRNEKSGHSASSTLVHNLMSQG